MIDAPKPHAHRGWHTPRKLPHFDSADTTHAITFRLADALPKEVVAAKRDEGNAAYRRRIEAALDRGVGACWLAREDVAEIVAAVLQRRDNSSYDLHAYVVMPNHVHALITQRDGNRLADVVKAWKSIAARAINLKLARSGRVWQREYHDRYMRDEAHFERTRAYIEANPVLAGLVEKPEDWLFSSCGSKRRD